MKNQRDLSTTEKILVVDDTPINLRLLVDILTKSGYLVCPVSDGQMALETARLEAPDLILLDVMMPDMDGYEVCRLLKADPATQSIPVIFVSALDETFDKVQGFKVGGVDYITKPFEYEDILARIKTHLGIQRLQQQLEAQNVRLQQEIDERKRNEEKYRLLAENSSDAVALIEHGKVIYVSPAYENICGYQAGELIGTALEKSLARIHPDDEERILRLAEQGITEKLTVQQYAFRIAHKNGSYVWVEDVVKREFDDQGHHLRTVVNTRDITERKLLEEQLYQSQKMEAIGHLAGGVAHHFNNMLTTIMGYVDLSLSELSSTEALFQDLQVIKKTTQRAAELTRHLLAFTRKQVIQPKVINLNDLILSTKSMFLQLIDESIELTTSLAPDLNQVKMDAGQFEQLLVNLVINARDAMPTGGKLDVRTENIHIDSSDAHQYTEIPSGDYVKLTVADTGVGIAEEIKPRIFDPFFTTKEVGQGTGLGLSTCFGIVKQHNGHIKVNSQSKRGTSFEVYLPSLLETQPAGDLPSNDKLPVGNETILIVEDESAVREMTVHVLRKHGYNVLEANNGALALQMVNQETIPRIDLLLTDVVMPQLGGQVLAAQLKVKYPHLKILFVSGYADKLINSTINQDTIFLAKPFGPATLAQKVRSLLDRSTKELGQP